MENTTAFVVLAAAIAFASAVIGGTMAQGKAASIALEGIARNPAAAEKLQTPMILALALIESLVLFGFIIALLILGKAA
jgi:F-type H+-transporting ATPase subunit c